MTAPEDPLPPPATDPPTSIVQEQSESTQPEPAPAPVQEPARDPLAHRRAEPRGFAFLWTCYLLGCTVIAIGQLGHVGLTTYEVYRPAAKVLLTLVLAGASIFWPLVRLSQERPGRPLRSFFADAIVVLGPGSAIIFSQSLPGMAGWSLTVVLAIIAFAAAWTLMMCGVLTMAVTSSRPRWVWMLAVVALCGAGPGMGVILGVGDSEAANDNPFLLTSPLTVTYEIAHDRYWTGETAATLPSHWAAIGAIGGLGLMTVGASAFRKVPVASDPPAA